MANRSYEYRRYKRYVKGIKRVKQDRAEHGNPFQAPIFGPVCECFAEDATHGKGKTFARFADYPAHCSCYMCTGWKRGTWEKDHPNKVPYED